MLKLAALGALGYVGYKYYQTSKDRQGESRASSRANLAGGPLSSDATVQHNPSVPAI